MGVGCEEAPRSSLPAPQAHFHRLQLELTSQLGFFCGKLKAPSDLRCRVRPIGDRQKLCALLALYNHGEPAISYPDSYTSHFSYQWIGWLCTSSFPSSGWEAPWGILPSGISTSVLIGSTLSAVWHRRFCRRFPKHSRVAAQQRESSGLSCCLTFGCLRAYRKGLMRELVLKHRTGKICRIKKVHRNPASVWPLQSFTTEAKSNCMDIGPWETPTATGAVKKMKLVQSSRAIFLAIAASLFTPTLAPDFLATMKMGT